MVQDEVTPPSHRGAVLVASVRRHPLRFVTTILISLVLGFLVWVYVALATGGTRFGPGEFVVFDTEAELRAHGFFEQGAHWPGSEIHLHETERGYVLERHWLGWREVAVPVESRFGFDTASYRYGTGEFATVDRPRAGRHYHGRPLPRHVSILGADGTQRSGQLGPSVRRSFGRFRPLGPPFLSARYPN